MIDPTAILYGAMIVKTARDKEDKEEQRSQERRGQRDEFWRNFHDDMDRTFKRGKYHSR